jgi:hypothetical protein
MVSSYQPTKFFPAQFNGLYELVHTWKEKCQIYNEVRYCLSPVFARFNLIKTEREKRDRIRGVLGMRLIPKPEVSREFLNAVGYVKRNNAVVRWV